jgi:hypothetical protein
MQRTTIERTTHSRGMRPAPFVSTLLEVVNAVSDVATNDEEVVAVICDLLASGRMKMIGKLGGNDFNLV